MSGGARELNDSCHSRNVNGIPSDPPQYRCRIIKAAGATAQLEQYDLPDGTRTTREADKTRLPA